MCSICGLGRSPGGGNGNPVYYSCLGNPMDKGAWHTVVHGIAKSQMQLSDWAQAWAFNIWVWKQRYNCQKTVNLHLRDHEIELWLEKPCQTRICWSERLGSAEGENSKSAREGSWERVRAKRITLGMQGQKWLSAKSDLQHCDPWPSISIEFHFNSKYSTGNSAQYSVIT